MDMSRPSGDELNYGMVASDAGWAILSSLVMMRFQSYRSVQCISCVMQR